MLNFSDSDLRSKICTVVKVTIEAHGPRLYFIYMYFSNIYSFITSPLLPAFYIHFLKMNLNLVFVSFIFCFWITFAFLNFLCTITICFMVHVEPAYKIVCKQLKLQILKSKSINIVYLLEYTDLLYVSVVLLLYAVYWFVKNTQHFHCFFPLC